MVNNMSQIEGSKDSIIKDIFKDIYSYSNSKVQKSREPQIENIIRATVNGDIIEKYLVIDIKLEGKDGIYVYILTNKKLIQISIDIESKVDSLSFLLSQMLGVTFKSLQPERLIAEVNFFNGKLGIDYSAPNKRITSFFQAVEQKFLIE